MNRLPLSRVLDYSARILLSRIFPLFWIAVANAFGAETLDLPKRALDAATGTAVLERIKLAPITERETIIVAEILAGNVPLFLRTLRAIDLRKTIEGREIRATIHVAPDYLAVGSDNDYLLTPLRPAAAQKIADRLDCLLPTPRIVDAIYAAAPLKLPPRPLTPGSKMTTMLVFAEHNRIVREQRLHALATFPLGTLTAGHKKDVVLAAALREKPGKVAIYGWHRSDSAPIQPLYLGHTTEWVDYSHGIRLVSQKAVIGDTPRRLGQSLADPRWSPLWGEDGPIAEPRYPAAE